MLDYSTSIAYKWQAPDAVAMHGWRSNQVRSSPAMAKPYFRSNYAEVKTQHQPPFDNCVCIPLTHGHHALIDSEDYSDLSNSNWIYFKGKGGEHVRCSGSKKLMHRIIMNASSGQIIDHANRNPLDNRKKNLRFCTHSQNQFNKTKTAGTASRYKGIYYAKDANKWVAKIRKNNRVYALGRYEDELHAAMVYNTAALLFHGEFAIIDYSIGLLDIQSFLSNATAAKSLAAIDAALGRV